MIASRPGPGETQFILVHARSRLLALLWVATTCVGRTTNLWARLANHNEGGSPHTSKFRPWKLVAVVSVPSEARAIELERYFKSGSGHAFARKHLW